MLLGAHKTIIPLWPLPAEDLTPISDHQSMRPAILTGAAALAVGDNPTKVPEARLTAITL